MTRHKLDDRLLDLTPADLEMDPGRKLQELEAKGVEREAVQSELEYLRIISARKVALPSDAYFAQARQQIYARVTIQPVSFWSRLRALVLPESLRPTPALVTSAILVVAIVATLVYHSPTGRQSSPMAFGPYVSLGEVYQDSIAKMDVGKLSEQDLKEYRQVLIMSTAILGSPSSLSRSLALAGGGK